MNSGAALIVIIVIAVLLVVCLRKSPEDYTLSRSLSTRSIRASPSWGRASNLASISRSKSLRLPSRRSWGSRTQLPAHFGSRVPTRTLSRISNLAQASGMGRTGSTGTSRTISSGGARYPAPQQGLSWGHAYNPSTGTWSGIVPGSSISGLQTTYQHMFAPRSASQMSGQQQMRQHLAPGGLGHTGWTFPRRP